MAVPTAQPPPRAPADAIGLTTRAAAQRLTEDGPNELQRQQARPAWRLLLSQFASPLTEMLIAAAVVSGALGDVAEAVAILAIVLLNVFVGFFQEHRAERAVLALRSLTAPRARVLRDGIAKVVPAAEVVVGDVLLLEGGDVVAADARLVVADAPRPRLHGHGDRRRQRPGGGGCPSSNPRLIAVVVLTCTLQVGLAAWEPSRTLFALAAPEPLQLSIAAAAGLLPPTLFEAWKLLRR